MGVWLTVLLVALAMFLYKNFFATAIDTTLGPTDVASEGAGKVVVDLYQRLGSVKLDTTLFSSPVYQSLTDFTVPIVPEPQGSPVPFGTKL